MHKPEVQNHDLEFLSPTSFEIVGNQTQALLKQTYFSLGKLDGVLANMDSLELLLAPTVIIESVKSSNIESINSTILEQLEISIKGMKTLTIEQRLTENYKDALLAGFEYITHKQKFDLDLILLVQQILLPDQYGIRDMEPVVIANTATGQVLHRPPIGKKLLLKYLENWLDFANNFKEIDILVKTAVLHAQFESIHPFVDGNGRTGRVLIILFLIHNKLLSYPCLFISDYILRTRTYYYLALRDVQKHKKFQSIVQYLTKAILEKSQFSYNLIANIKELQKYYHEQIQKKLPQIYSQELLEYLFINPFYSISNIQKHLQISRNTASKYLNLLVKLDFIQARDSHKNKIFFNPAFLKLIS
ncbi:MAG: Fic family protein [bacterium]